ncbi:Zinc finger C2H2-type [Trinorchestia longiramus]|nr:Zinc finger C2H2-type [Trinorchestia longiramus]
MSSRHDIFVDKQSLFLHQVVSMADASSCGTLEGLSDELDLHAFALSGGDAGGSCRQLGPDLARNASTCEETDFFFPRLDDLNPAPDSGSQMTDLTNSLPRHKSASSCLTAQSILAKLECPDMNSSLNQSCSASSNQPNRKLEADLFGVVCGSGESFDEGHGSSNNQSLNQTLEPTDVYGRVTCYDGKIVLQLRLLNLNTNFPMNVSECWLCRNKVQSGTPVYAHKHMFSGVFQVSDEYIHIIIPEREMELEKSVFQSSFDRSQSSADFSKHIGSSTDLDLRESLDCKDNLTLPYIARAFGLDERIIEHESNVNAVEGGGCSEDFTPNVPLSTEQPSYSSVNIQNETETRVAVPVSHNTLKDVKKWGESKIVETGARKRKSKAQKKPSVIRMRDDVLQDVSFFPSVSDVSSVIDPSRIQSEDPNKSLRRKPLRKPNLDQQSDSACFDSTLVQQSQKMLDANFKLVKRIIAKTENLTCRVCKARFGRSLSDYRQHMKTEHSLPDNSLYECPVCLKKFSVHNYLVQHVKIHLGVKAFKCDKCGTTYGREESLKRHLLSHGQKKPHVCSICPKAFSRAEYLKAHVQAHNRVRYPCHKCSVACSSKFNLEMHMRKHWQEKPYVCELCSKAFSRNDYLDTHMEVVHKKNKPKCSVCGKMFARKDILKRHMSTHKEASFDCNFCLRSFTRRDRLLAHKRTHEINRELQCSKCPASFHRREVFLKHQQLHETREECHVCHKFFKSKEKLAVHLKCHRTSEKHSCEVCGKTVARTDLLQKHLRRVHGWIAINEEKSNVAGLSERVKEFVCEICSKGFTRSCNLRTHVIKVHGSKDHTENDDEDDPEELDGLNSALSKSRPSQRTLVDLSSRTSKSSYVPSQNNNATSSPLGVPSTYSLLAVSSSASIIDASMEASSSWYPRSGSASPAPHLPGNLSLPQLSSQHSPVNLSAEAITAAAYLLAYPSYLGPYQ